MRKKVAVAVLAAGLGLGFAGPADARANPKVCPAGTSFSLIKTNYLFGIIPSARHWGCRGFGGGAF